MPKAIAEVEIPKNCSADVLRMQIAEVTKKIQNAATRKSRITVKIEQGD